MIAKFEEHAKIRNDTAQNPITIPKKYRASDEMSFWINKRKADITL
jgi:hypothetical protein